MLLAVWARTGEIYDVVDIDKARALGNDFFHICQKASAHRDFFTTLHARYCVRMVLFGESIAPPAVGMFRFGNEAELLELLQIAVNRGKVNMLVFVIRAAAVLVIADAGKYLVCRERYVSIEKHGKHCLLAFGQTRHTSADALNKLVE